MPLVLYVVDFEYDLGYQHACNAHHQEIKEQLLQDQRPTEIVVAVPGSHSNAEEHGKHRAQPNPAEESRPIGALPFVDDRFGGQLFSCHLKVFPCWCLQHSTDWITLIIDSGEFWSRAGDIRLAPSLQFDDCIAGKTKVRSLEDQLMARSLALRRLKRNRAGQVRWILILSLSIAGYSWLVATGNPHTAVGLILFGLTVFGALLLLGWLSMVERCADQIDQLRLYRPVPGMGLTTVPSLLDELLETDPRSGELHFIKAKFLRAIGDSDAAAQYESMCAELGYRNSPVIEVTKRTCPGCNQKACVAARTAPPNPQMLFESPTFPQCAAETFVCVHCGLVSLVVTDPRVLQTLREATSCAKGEPVATLESNLERTNDPVLLGPPADTTVPLTTTLLRKDNIE